MPVAPQQNITMAYYNLERTNREKMNGERAKAMKSMALILA
ncbi:hypothetical protein KCO_15527 [Pectobacterium brasiliense ICMP 19477]|nr:hypothetical protein KCO_15527 [Pectobacterium brasiliense ICMP 19477]